MSSEALTHAVSVRRPCPITLAMCNSSHTGQSKQLRLRWCWLPPRRRVIAPVSALPPGHPAVWTRPDQRRDGVAEPLPQPPLPATPAANPIEASSISCFGRQNHAKTHRCTHRLQTDRQTQKGKPAAVVGARASPPRPPPSSWWLCWCVCCSSPSTVASSATRRSSSCQYGDSSTCECLAAVPAP